MRAIDADALIHELNNSHYPGAPYIDAGISIAIGKVCDAPTIEPKTCEDAVNKHGSDENKIRARLEFCEYCHEDSDGYVKPVEKNCHAFIRFGMDGWEISLSAKGWDGSAKIMYCPMCGRKL